MLRGTSVVVVVVVVAFCCLDEHATTPPIIIIVYQSAFRRWKERKKVSPFQLDKMPSSFRHLLNAYIVCTYHIATTGGLFEKDD